MHRLGSPVHSLSWFEAVAKNYVDHYKITLVKQGDKVIGAGFVIFSEDKVSIPWASTLAEYNKLAPNMLVYWSLLKYSCECNFTQFDFGRSTYGEGTYKFKKQWGAEPHILNWYNLNEEVVVDQNTNSGSNSAIRTMVEKVWRALPLSIVTWLGPMLRKHISL